jgi:hypothetical protein
VTPDPLVAPEPPDKPRFVSIAGVFLGLISIVPLLGLGIFYLEVPRLREQAFADLSHIAELKAGQIEAWLDQRRGDATVLTVSSGLVDNVIQAARGGDAAAILGLVERLGALKSAYSYDGFEVRDADARRILALGASERDPQEPVESALQAALRSGRVEMTDLYRDGSGRVHLDFIAPLVQGKEGRRQVVGAVILDAPVERIVFPLIQS